MPDFEEVRTITPDGRLIVPWIIQRALGLEHGGPVRFHVDNGVVTLSSAEGRRPGSATGIDGEARPTDIRNALKRELDTLLSSASPNLATDASRDHPAEVE
jgi:bifunctional DNA-binding transcriptional regulator/antitoxin component of YhaV-PrlF toxin-antitoxin module